MPKSARWTIYVAIFIGVIAFGYYITITKPPPKQSATSQAPAAPEPHEDDADEGLEDTASGQAPLD